MKLKFEGGKQLEAALKALDISQARKKGIARRALDKAAEPIKEAWQRGVDRDEGDLMRSVKVGNRAQTRGTRKFKRGAGQDVVERFVGIDASEDERDRLAAKGKSRGYAYIEEFGNENHAANPAGRAAWESKKVASFDMIADTLRAEIEKTAKAEARKAAKR